MTTIEWTDETWNPTRGCSRVSEGCRNCYAERVAARFSAPGQPYASLVRLGKGGPRWTGTVRLVPEMLGRPLRWRKARRVFVNSMSDLFHPMLSNEDIAAVFGVMGALGAQHHTFQVLTKRPERMREWFQWVADEHCGLLSRDRWPNLVCARAASDALSEEKWDRRILVSSDIPWPLPNVWLGVSVEDQVTADERIPLLLDTPAAVRFVSYEPALGPVSFGLDLGVPLADGTIWTGSKPRLDWIIAGSESGPGARPADLDWYRSVRDQCAGTGVAFFLKQHAERGKKLPLPELDGRQHVEWPA